MAQSLSIDNYTSLNTITTTVLDADAAVGATALTVKDNLDFLVNDQFIIGSLGSQKSEKLSVTSLTGNTVINTAATKFNYLRFDVLTKLFGDKMKIYTAPNVDGTIPADAAFTNLLTTLTIDIDNKYTNYTDPAGSSAVWYKYTYFNSVSSAETSLADSVAVRGGNVGSYCTIDDIRQEAGMMNNPYITNVMIDQYRQQAQAEINSTLSGLYVIPFTAPINYNIQLATKLISAGLLLKSDYGPMASGSSKAGEDKLTDGYDLLAKIDDRTIVLLDVLGNETIIVDAGSVTSWPNNTTNGADYSNGGDNGHVFRMSYRF